MARMHHTDFKAPAPEGEKGIGKLRVWERNGLGRLRVSRAIGMPHFLTTKLCICVGMR